MNAPAFDTGTLSWVKDEIDLALERAGAALARHAAAPDEAKPLDEARSHLHQACGALTLVGLTGVTHFAETVETHLAALADNDTHDVVAVDAAAGGALAALRRYLDELMAGHPDQPLRLFPAYRALALAAGQAAPSPHALFFPDLTQRPPRRAGAAPLPAARLKALRLGCARGLAKARGGDARGPTEMRNALAILEQGIEQPAERAPWWIALAWFDAQPAPDEALLAELDARMEMLAQGTPVAAVAAGFPPALLAAMLYDIAVAPPGGEQLECVRAAYRLADLVPGETAGVETRRETCRAPLTTAMEEWERFSRGAAIALMRFHDVSLLLAASARDSGDTELARLTAAIADFAAWLRQQPERTDQTLALEVASALVLVEDAIEQEGARNPADEPLFAAEVTAEIERLATLRQGGTYPAPIQLGWRARLLVGQVAREIRANLDAAEPLLDAYFQSPERMAELPAVQALLHQTAGAFRLLEEDAAARLAAATAAEVALYRENSDAAAEHASVANWLARLAQFADSLIRSQPDRELLAAAGAEVASMAGDLGTVVPAVPPSATTQVGRDEELRAIFIEEAHDVLAALAAAQPALAANPADRDALKALRRGFHTLKGSGRMVGLAELGDAAYAVERLLNRWLDERRPADAGLQEVVTNGRQLFDDWVVALEGKATAPDPAALVAHCDTLHGGESATAPAAETAPVAAPSVPQGFPAVTPTLTLVQTPPAKEVVTIGTLSLAPTLFGIYIDEARGHVGTLRRELSGPAAVPSRETIRAAHTLAGISAGTGFPPVQALAHALETALVRHSLARATPDEGGRMLLARAVGALEGMVGAIAERRFPADETTLAAALETLQIAAPEAPPPTAPAVSPLAERRQSRPADEIDNQLAALFLEEADEQLRQLGEELHTWRETPAQVEIGRGLARLLHTFKGGARMCGAMGIGELAHSMETRIEQAIAAGSADAAVLDGLDTSLDRANHLLGVLRPQVGAAPAAAAARPAPTEAARPAPPAAAPPTGEAAPAVLLRVRADLVDHLVNEAGEMAISRSRVEGSLKHFKGALIDLTENVARLRSQLREFEIHAESRMQSQLGEGAARRDFDPLEFDRFTRLQELTRMMAESVNDVATVQHALLRQVDVAATALAAQSRQNRELSHALLRARMVPFATVVDRLHRVVRQTARDLDRQANLDIRGGDTPVDRGVLERMLGPLEHLLRNAVAHGIEPAAVRRAAGKPELGQIALTIAPGDNDIALTLSDDGRGLDHAAIRRRAVERGLLAPEDEVDDATLAELIFRPGFSTATTVSEIAGRGVGLDVVRNEVAQLGGHVEVGGAPGQGTHFEIVLPLTLAVIPVMLVESDGRAWAIPAAMVEEVRELSAGETAGLRADGYVARGSRRFAHHTLQDLFGMARVTPAPAHCWQLLLKGGGSQIALEADALTQSQEVVVKPLGEQLARVPGLTGATVLGDGSVALIVNPVALALRPVAPVSTAVSPAPTFQAPAVMVVDDSLTVRKITGRLLERAGYRVTTAKDGVDALEQLAHGVPDVMLADIEMPRMDGFELVRALRAEPRLADLPVIMITSRIADKHRQVAAGLGVKHYLGKPYDDAELLDLIAGLVRR
jgi:chemosensory pili system protein ChpA (sensor histidine kinase/response regulator)